MSTVSSLPTFREIAAMRIADAGPRDRNINVKVAINTARMMIESENNSFDAMRQALQDILAQMDKVKARGADWFSLGMAISKAEAALKLANGEGSKP